MHDLFIEFFNYLLDSLQSLTDYYLVQPYK